MNLRSQKNNQDNVGLKVKYCRDIPNNLPHSIVFTINLDPNNFISLSNETMLLNEKWFTNLTNIEIPQDVQYILQLGDNFNLPFTNRNKEKLIVELIKNVECNIDKLPPDKALTMRERSLSIIDDLVKNRLCTSENDARLLKAVSATRRFMRDNLNIIFTRADKGISQSRCCMTITSRR